MEVKLIVANGKNAGQELRIAGRKFFIGRAEDCHLRPHSELVSRHHCVILIEDQFVAVRDFGSRNGTFINGRRIKTEQELKMGDRLKIGPLEFEVKLVVEVGGKKKPKVRSVQEAAARTVETVEDQDLDLSDLLGLEPEVPTGATAAETQPMEATQTGAATAATGPSPLQDADEEEEAEEPEPPKVVGRWEGAKKPEAGTSRDAATEMLKNFFKS